MTRPPRKWLRHIRSRAKDFDPPENPCIYGLRWQSEAATPLWIHRPDLASLLYPARTPSPIRKRQRTAPVQDASQSPTGFGLRQSSAALVVCGSDSPYFVGYKRLVEITCYAAVDSQTPSRGVA